MSYYKSDLKGTYQWHTTQDDPKLRGEPDHSLFSRHEGWEVLYLANKFAAKKGFSDNLNLHKLEDLLANKLPSGLHSQKHVYDWLDNNW